MCVISPLVPKSRSSWLAGSRFPLPDTVDCTMPRDTVTVRSCALDADGEPTTRTAATTAAAVNAPNAMVMKAGRRGMSARARRGRALIGGRRPVAAVGQGHPALLERVAQLLEL